MGNCRARYFPQVGKQKPQVCGGPFERSTPVQQQRLRRVHAAKETAQRQALRAVVCIARRVARTVVLLSRRPPAGVSCLAAREGKFAAGMAALQELRAGLRPVRRY